MKTKRTEYAPPPPERGIFCNRTLNLRSIKAIGYDMDYTLIHYYADAWERRAYEHIRMRLHEEGLPVDDLEYDPAFIVRGLIIDIDLGNIVKANRFGYVKQAYHGTRHLAFEIQRDTYARSLVALSEGRFVFLNTLFSLSEACMFAQLVDRLDEGRLPKGVGYADLFRRVHRALDEAHAEGTLKADILSSPDEYIVPDRETPLALLDQKQADKKLILITNSEWDYTRRIMGHAFDPYLPEGTTWRDLFDLIIVSARKPSFFADPNPAFEVVNEEGLLQPVVGGLRTGGIYVGGNAMMIEKHWGLTGEDFLYVGDHIFADVTSSKKVLRWRTALIMRELEDELAALAGFRDKQARLSDMMHRKQELEFQSNQVRLALQRHRAGVEAKDKTALKSLQAEGDRLRNALQELDTRIGPLARESGELMNPNWGLIMRAGNDKSHMARQVENYADIYMSRVSNFLFQTPYVYLRSPRSSLPHDSTGVHTSGAGVE